VRSSAAATGCRFGTPTDDVYAAVARAVFARRGPTTTSTLSDSTSLRAFVSESSGLPASSSTIVSTVTPPTSAPLISQYRFQPSTISWPAIAKLPVIGEM
jgi:hypothetical protein